MAEQNYSNMTGKILIATPFAMQGNVFYQSMIYVIQHTPQGSIGLIFNRPVSNMPADTLFRKVNSQIVLPELDLEVHIGGPVEIERGFFLHTTDYDKNLLFKPTDNNLAVSSNAQILNDITEGKGPNKAIFIIGYTGWGAGQMEFEIENNLWLVAEPDEDLIFSENAAIKWNMAVASLGINTNEFVPAIGSC